MSSRGRTPINASSPRPNSPISASASPAASSSNNSSSSNNNSSNSSTTTVVKRVLLLLSLILRILLWPLARLSSIVFPPGEYDGITNPRNADAAARSFVAHFNSFLDTSNNTTAAAAQHDNNSNNNNNRNQHNPFSDMSYSKTLTEAKRNSKPIFIYLHSPLHRDCDTFIRNELCHASILRFLNNDNLVCWGGSVHSADGANVASMLGGVTVFPFVGLLAVNGGNNNGTNNNSRTTIDLLLKLQGAVSTEELLTRLTLSLQHHQSRMEEIQLRNLQRQEEIHLRQEQDREYQETLLADQQREATARRIEEEARESLAREQEEKERRENARQLKLEECRRKLREEPPMGGSDVISRIRFTLPSGTRMERRFYQDDTVEAIKAFLVLYLEEQNSHIKNFSISTNYPKKVFDMEGDDKERTLKEVGLVPQAVIMIQDLDA